MNVTVLIVLLWEGTSAFAFSIKSPMLFPAGSSKMEQAITNYSSPRRHAYNLSQISVSMSNEVNKSSTSIGGGGAAIRGALKKMRGISISVEYSPVKNGDVPKTSPIEIELLSQELRKAKVSSIWTCDSEVIQCFSKEQNSAKGNFPGPVPIVYQHLDGGGEQHGQVHTDTILAAIENGASAIVLDSDLLDVYKTQIDMSSDCGGGPVDVICRVENVQHVQMALEAGYDSAFLLSGSQHDEEIRRMLSAIPKSAVVIVSLSSMQPDSQEISRAKILAGLASDSANVASVLIHDACVGDQEDIKYSSFVVENINKKSSSTFQMTGLTGAANGHFGSEVSGGFRAAKWQRNKNDAET